MQQQQPSSPSSSPTVVGPAGGTFIATYGPFILSVLAVLLIATAWLLHDVDQTTALAIIGAILAGNGLVTATQWQAAPSLITGVEGLISVLIAHIQVLHAQQTASTPLTAQLMTTAAMPTAQPTAMPDPTITTPMAAVVKATK